MCKKKDKIPAFLEKVKKSLERGREEIYCPYCQTGAQMKMINIKEIDIEKSSDLRSAVYRCSCGKECNYNEIICDINEAISHYEALPEIKVEEVSSKHSSLLGQNYSGSTLRASNKGRFGYAMHSGGRDSGTGINPHGATRC